jgi:DNA (cytosine-5)-methyltransferase 1
VTGPQLTTGSPKAPFFDVARLLQSSRNFDDEIIVDLFAGGGGASCGIELALGRSPDIAINHDPEAVALHQANHPRTTHYVSDIFDVDPPIACGGFPIGLLWASPDCKHFSKAKGGKPVSKKIRSLAWVVVKWARMPIQVRPRVICLENVEEFQTWGPLDANNKPCPLRKGRTFRRWKRSLEQLGYVVEHRELRACDYGAPTIRKRLILVARCDGVPIVWPEPTHGAPDTLPVRAGKLKPWHTAAECIDWSIPAPSIFERVRPLAEATLRRIAKGLVRYVIDAKEPFIVSLTHQGGDRVERVTEPFKTITGAKRGEKAVVDVKISPFITEHANASNQRNMPADEPLRTQLAQVKGGHFALVSAFLAQYNNHSGVDPHAGRSAAAPVSTVTTTGMHQSLVTSNLVKLRGTSRDGQPVDTPLHTISAQGQHFAEVRAFIVKYYGNEKDGVPLTDPMHTIPTKDRMGLVMVHGEPFAIVDIGMRMLAPRELYRAQGFPESYIIEHGADGKPLTKTAQVRMCGNSVCPPLARAIVAANYTEIAALQEVA